MMGSQIDKTREQVKLNAVQRLKAEADIGLKNQEKEHRSLINPEKLEEQRRKNTGLDLSNELKVLNKEIAQTDLDVKKYYRDVEMVIDRKIKTAKLSSMEREVLTKQVALEMARHDFEYYRNAKMPSNAPPTNEIKNANALTNALEEIWKKLFPDKPFGGSAGWKGGGAGRGF